MTDSDLNERLETPASFAGTSPNRRKFMTLLTGASLALAAGMIASCSGWDMRAAPKKPTPKTYIIGRQGGSGGNMRKEPARRP